MQLVSNVPPKTAIAKQSEEVMALLCDEARRTNVEILDGEVKPNLKNNGAKTEETSLVVQLSQNGRGNLVISFANMDFTFYKHA